MSTICTKIKDAEEEANYLLKEHYPKPPKKNHSRLKHLNALKDNFENIITVERKLRSSFSPNTSIKLNGVLNANLTNANAQVEPRFEPNKVTRTYKKKRPTISNGSAPKLNTNNLLSVEQSLLPRYVIIESLIEYKLISLTSIALPQMRWQKTRKKN